jgi:regulator of sigma E protease
MEFITDILWFIAALGVLVFVHELGHFLVAKKAGIRVERFSLGFPPKMVGIQVGETEYCLSWIPLGGYVKVAGMADVGSEETTGAPWEYPSKSIPVRMAVIAAGPFMNFLFAFLILAVLYLSYGIATVPSTSVMPQEDSASARAGMLRGDRIVSLGGSQVGNEYELVRALEKIGGGGGAVQIERNGQILDLELAADDQSHYGLQLMYPPLVGPVGPGRPAAAVGLQEGDRVVEVAGQPVVYWSEMRDIIRRHLNQTMSIVWERDGERINATITPEEGNIDGQTVGVIGIGIYSTTVDIPTGEALSMSIQKVYDLSWHIVDLLGQIFQGERYKELGGPLAIAQMAAQTAESGFDRYLSFLAMLSVNLAVLNLLPVPVLDGGHLTFLTLEAIMRRPLSLRQREMLQQVGGVFILGIMVLVFYNDLKRMVFPFIETLFQ